MLPAARRLRARQDFTDVLRHGRRAGRSTLTVHLDVAGAGSAAGPARAGLVVSRAVGGSVVRSQVSRRLRHLLRDRLPDLEPGTRLVVRASPAAARSTSEVLGADLDAALTRARRPGPPDRARR